MDRPAEIEECAKPGLQKFKVQSEAVQSSTLVVQRYIQLNKTRHTLSQTR